MNAIKVAALAALLSVSAAFAQEPTQQQPAGTESMDYTKLDTNGDGNVSKDEARADATLSAKFDKLDADKNGSLSSDELKADLKKKTER
jgi:EF hand